MAMLGAPIALATLGGCAADRSYVLEQGRDASYDALRAATGTCEQKGGKIRLRDGYDGRTLSDYECAIGKAE
jgi:hypothetical protein